ncbi:gamma carbonic anhydrase family protein [Vagococcus lutrae]|uniref:gamma carbonic anhydrase family protein n=1 Tax=Vagococcus lutrae TaxID=81947 RepID=UPI001C9777D8|nr:gamma carbonic anhydrase family protein [Vagococcus lutrae]MCO7151555.1 gamma carbonic anhydrase family protein [Vagococcus lutrae]MDT2812893.1 gamma carbonic anhydrase family protein [Vagococcus lutrae]MDT2819589.1 gamma carbonic anhydrase family protein [Vagococcus lutrae]MDT2824322.1 gamma carbonic anhydrase family protein [Vagococcus lutrae]MDT2844401.1 gamma carbonic anhydrase family protein [Vagococcus lutrae]
MRNFVAKSADLIGKIKLGEASTIWYQSVIRGDYGVISIGDRSNIQDGSVVHVDEQYPTVVGDDVTVGHRCIIHGCTIEDRVIVGMGSTIMNGAKIGQDSIVGANSLVTERKEFPPGSLIMGSPAKVIRALTDEEKQSILVNAHEYVQNGQKFEGKPITIDEDGFIVETE